VPDYEEHQKTGVPSVRLKTTTAPASGQARISMGFIEQRYR
jgi:hypothetical protein